MVELQLQERRFSGQIWDHQSGKAYANIFMPHNAHPELPNRNFSLRIYPFPGTKTPA